MSVLIVQAVKTAGLVAFYYCFSISLTFYNKWILTVSAYSAGDENVPFSEHCLVFLLLGLSVSPLHYHDPPHREVYHCMGRQETHLLGYGEIPGRFRLERVSAEHFTSW